MKKNRITKQNKNKKIRKLLQACGHQKNDHAEMIRYFDGAFATTDDFIKYLKEEAQYRKEEIALIKEMNSFISGTNALARALDGAKQGGSKDE